MAQNRRRKPLHFKIREMLSFFLTAATARELYSIAYIAVMAFVAPSAAPLLLAPVWDREEAAANLAIMTPSNPRRAAEGARRRIPPLTGRMRIVAGSRLGRLPLVI